MKIKLNLSSYIFLGFVIGILLGIIFGKSIIVIQPVGELFLKLMQMIVVPLITITIIHGITNLGDITKLKRIGGKVVVYYFITTALAATIGIILANIFQPGAGVELSNINTNINHQIESPSFVKTILDMVPSNPFDALTQGNLIQIIVFSSLIGVSITISGEKAAGIKNFFAEANDVVFKLVNIIIWTAPVGVGALIAVTIGLNGFSIFGPMGKLIFVDFLGASVILFVFYVAILKLYVRIGIGEFFGKILKVWVVTASTASSTATLPVSMKVMKEDFQAPDDIIGFALPLGATINMNGAANYFAIVVLFAAQVYGINMTLSEQIITVLLATLVSIGAPGIAGGGIVLTIMLLKTMSLPMDIIGMIAAVYRIIDTVHTTVNVSGDLVATLVVSKSEKLWPVDKV